MRNLNLPPKQAVIDQFIRMGLLPAGTLESVFLFSAVSAHTPTDEVPYNTVLKLTSTRASVYTGYKSFYYNRIDLAEMSAGFPKTVQYDLTGLEAVYDLKDMFYQTLGLYLDGESIEDAVLDKSSDTVAVPLVAKPDSLLYIGVGQVNVGLLPDISLLIQTPQFDWDF